MRLSGDRRVWIAVSRPTCLLHQLIAGQLQLVLAEITVALTGAMAGMGPSTIVVQTLLLFSKTGEKYL